MTGTQREANSIPLLRPVERSASTLRASTGGSASSLDADGFRGAQLGSLREIIDWAEPVDAIGVDIRIGHVAAGSRTEHLISTEAEPVEPSPAQRMSARLDALGRSAQPNSHALGR